MLAAFPEGDSGQEAAAEALERGRSVPPHPEGASPGPGGSARPRVLLLTPRPPPAGGISTWTEGVLASSLARQFELRVVDTAPSARDEVHARSFVRADRILDALRILLRLVVELGRFRPDLVHVNTPYFWAFPRDALALRLSRLAGARTVLQFHGGDFPEFVQGLPRPLRALVRATLQRADRLVAITRHTASFLSRVASSERTALVPNFIRLEDVGTPPDRRARKGSGVEALFVGWVIEGKGVGELLDAAHELPGIRFTLVGTPQRSYLSRIRTRLEASRDRVQLLGTLSRADVMELYRRADLFVLPTHREGFPNVVLEAMAAGLPVVATPVGAIPDAVRDGEEGLLVPPRDPRALAAAIGSLARDPERRLRMGEKARRRVESLYALESVASRLAALYRGTLPSPR